MEIKYTALSSIVSASANPKRHATASIIQSIEITGFNDPPAIDERTGRLVEGHGRVQALEVMKARGDEAPANIQDRDGEWFLPIIRGLTFESDAHATAYLLAHNRLVEAGGWDLEAVAAMVRDITDFGIDPNTLGWSPQAIKKMVEDSTPTAPDEFKAYDETLKTKSCCPKCGYEF